MHFSCKISNAVLSALDEMGVDTLPIVESVSIPEEFLRDPSYWIQSKELELFLSRAQSVAPQDIESSLFEHVGHKTPRLRAWGVLDSVLRMMPTPQEILSQPERFLAYFVSPAPPVDGVKVSASGLEFDLPISADQYPLTTSYLKAALEALPVYVGKPMATCKWEGIHLSMDWGAEQNSIFQEDPGHQLSPDLMRTVMSSLEQHQKDLEEKNRELQAKNEQLKQAQAEMQKRLSQSFDLAPISEAPLKTLDFIDETSIGRLRSEVSRMGDYLVRAQQLITLLVGQDRLSPSVQAAMKKVDWERVQKQFPESIRQCLKILESTQENQSKEERKGV